jgi:hypothetical protein
MSTVADLWVKDPPKLRLFTPLPLVGEHFTSGDNPVSIMLVKDNAVWAPTDEPQITQLANILSDLNKSSGCLFRHMSAYRSNLETASEEICHQSG